MEGDEGEDMFRGQGAGVVKAEEIGSMVPLTRQAAGET